MNPEVQILEFGALEFRDDRTKAETQMESMKQLEGGISAAKIANALLAAAAENGIATISMKTPSGDSVVFSIGKSGRKIRVTRRAFDSKTGRSHTRSRLESSVAFRKLLFTYVESGFVVQQPAAPLPPSASDLAVWKELGVEAPAAEPSRDVGEKLLVESAAPAAAPSDDDHGSVYVVETAEGKLFESSSAVAATAQAQQAGQRPILVFVRRTGTINESKLLLDLREPAATAEETAAEEARVAEEARAKRAAAAPVAKPTAPPVVGLPTAKRAMELVVELLGTALRFPDLIPTGFVVPRWSQWAVFSDAIRLVHVDEIGFSGLRVEASISIERRYGGEFAVHADVSLASFSGDASDALARLAHARDVAEKVAQAQMILRKWLSVATNVETIFAALEREMKALGVEILAARSALRDA